MFLHFTLYSFFIIVPLLFGNANNTSSSSSVPVSKLIANKTTTAKPATSFSDKSNGQMLSEGGSVLQVVPVLTSINFSKENHTDYLLGLDKELGKPKEKPVVPRKGVSMDDSLYAKADSHQERVDTTITKAPSGNNSSKILDRINNSTIDKSDFNNVTVTTIKVTKPTVLSYEALNAMDKKSVNVQLPKTETSSKSVVANQLPTPNVKIQTMSSSRHPGMVMPIVITMLVVPMFAVLGYLALRRGQEAWKNRHYKRMDFLLDGMYND